MSVYAEEVMKRAIDAYSQCGSFKHAAFVVGAHPRTVRKWVYSYAIFGDSLFTDNPKRLECVK